MTAAQTISNYFWRWLDDVASALMKVVARLAAQRTIRLVEAENGQFAVQKSDITKSGTPREVLRFEDGKIAGDPPGAAEAALRGGRVELMLRPDRFLFKPLELPSRATEFLDGVVRAQIDRLTPWGPERAAFGYSTPVDAGGGRIVVTVAATAKGMVAPYLQAFAESGARSVTMLTRAPEEPAAGPAIKILEENITGILDGRQARRIVLVTLAVGFLLATGAVTAATVMGGSLQERQDELARSIATRRAAVIAARNAPGDPLTEAERGLARRKNESPSTVIVLEVLSQILPDHTYVTEMRIEANKLRLSGVTNDAPGLIRLIEQSRQFTSATFFAPTTRGPSDSGDRFNIQAQMEPVFSPRP